jgi:hypothetical protein
MLSLEKSGNHASYPKSGGFAKLLDWHLNFGIRPSGGPERPGKRWSNKEFTEAVGGVDERTVRNWRAGRSRPNDLGSIERALFGTNPACDQWRFELRAAYDGYGQSADSTGIPRPLAHSLGSTRNVAALPDNLLTSPASQRRHAPHTYQQLENHLLNGSCYFAEAGLDDWSGQRQSSLVKSSSGEQPQTKPSQEKWQDALLPSLSSTWLASRT